MRGTEDERQLVSGMGGAGYPAARAALGGLRARRKLPDFGRSGRDARLLGTTSIGDIQGQHVNTSRASGGESAPTVVGRRGGMQKDDFSAPIAGVPAMGGNGADQGRSENVSVPQTEEHDERRELVIGVHEPDASVLSPIHADAMGGHGRK
jgi:hypothetical protein